MSWREIAVIAEAAASVAVVISLIYLAIQVRLQSKQNEMSVVNTLTQQWGEALHVFATDRELYEIWMRGIEDFDGLSAVERGRFSAVLVSLTQIFEGLHLHHKAGKVDAGLWEGFDNRLRDVFALPGVQSWWALRRHWHTRKFQDYVDRAIAASNRQGGRYVAIYGANPIDPMTVPDSGNGSYAGSFDAYGAGGNPNSTQATRSENAAASSAAVKLQ